MSDTKRSIAELAHLSTLSEEEMDEQEESGIEYEEDPEEGVDGDERDYSDESQENSEKDDTVTSAVPKKPAEKPRMVHTEPMYTVTARPTARQMFDFMMYHTYHNPAGILSVLIGIGAIVALVFNLMNKGETMVTVLLGVIIVMFIANSPVTIWSRAKKQAELISDSANTITYTFSGVGLDMTRGKEYAAYDWSRIEKVIESKECYYFYLTKNSAFVLPKENLAGNESGFRRIIENCGAKKIKLMKDGE